MKREHKNTPGEKKHPHDHSPAFIERTATLKEISEILNSGRNVLIVGQPKSGKTTIVSELKRTLAESNFECVLLELSQVPMTPEFYSVFAIKEMKKEFSKRKPETDAEKHVSEIISESEREIEGELLKVKPDHSRMIESVRDAMNKISAHLKQQKKKLLVIIDDGEELLNLENFPQVKSVLDMAGIENEESSKAPLFLITTSYSRAFGTSLSHFEKVNLKKYNDEEIKEFRDYHKIKHHWETLLNLTDRHPFVLNALARAMREKGNLEEAVILEFLNPDSATFQFFSAWVNDALSKARGATLQKAILQVIAKNGSLRLSEIARQIYRPAPVTKAMLERLMLTDIIVKEDNQFRFAYKPLGRWYKAVISFDELKEIPDSEEKQKELVSMLEGSRE